MLIWREMQWSGVRTLFPLWSKDELRFYFNFNLIYFALICSSPSLFFSLFSPSFFPFFSCWFLSKHLWSPTVSRSLFVGAVTQTCSLRVKLIDFLPEQRLLEKPSVPREAGVSGRTIDLMQTLAMILKRISGSNHLPLFPGMIHWCCLCKFSGSY